MNDSGSNGVTLDSQGNPVYCATRDHQIMRLEEDGRRTSLASQYEGKRLNGPNDLVYKSDGALYFTDNTLPPPPLGIADKDPAAEIPFNGVYLLKAGKVQLLFKDLPRPNGIILSADEKYLYVDDTLQKVIMRFEVQPDDTVANGKVWFKIDSDLGYPPYLPDGMKTDERGNLYSSGPGGLWIVSQQMPSSLGIVLVPIAFPITLHSAILTENPYLWQLPQDYIGSASKFLEYTRDTQTHQPAAFDSTI